MGIPWETLDETNQIYFDYFHIEIESYMEGVKEMAIIYCYTNQINNKKYIGQTINPEQRKNQHKSSAFNPADKDYEALIHRAFRKYGYENFTYEILAEIYNNDFDLLNELERYYILKLNSKVPNGYNVLDGGENCSRPHKEETKEKMRWSHAALTKEEVISLRIAYKERKSPTQIFKEKYEGRIEWQSFLNIWTGKRYATVMPEVFETEEGSGRKTKLTVEIVKAIREEREKTGKSYDKLAKQFGVSKATVADLIKRRTWKNV